MSKRAKRHSRPSVSASTHFGVASRPLPPRRGPILTQTAFGIAVAVVIARLLMTESIRAPISVYPGAPNTPAGPGPAAGLLLDLLAGLCPLLVLLRRRIDPSFTLRAAWSALIFVALAVWAVISTAWAADQFASMVSSCHLLAAAGLLWAVGQICRTPAYTRLTAGLCAGLLGVLLMHGLWHQFVERPELRKAWEQDRQSLLATRNLQEGSFEYIQFENKILRGELMGFSASPNTYAAMLVMLGLVTLGTAAELLRSRRWVVAGIMVILMLTAAGMLPLTLSRTAYLTGILGVVLLAAATMLGGLLRRRATLFYLAGALAVLTVFAFVIGYGVSRGTLFHDSLNFRWRYWVGAFEVWRQHPLLGVGWENFGPHYLTVRIPEATEEIKDPHNFLVRFAAELGLVGALLAIVWTAMTWWRITRPATAGVRVADRAIAAGRSTTPARTLDYATIAIAPGQLDRATLPLHWLGGLGAAMAAGFFLNFVSAIDFSQESGFVLLEGFRVCVYLLIALLLAMLVCMTLVRDGDASTLVFDAGPAPMIRAAIVVAVGMFFVHNLIDFAMFEIGPMFLMALLLGLAIAEGAPAAEAVTPDTPLTPAYRRGRNTAQAALAVAGAAWLIGAIAVVIPIVSSEAIAAEADVSFRKDVPPVAAMGYESAFENAIPNADYAYRAAFAWRWAGDNARAKKMFDQAIEADPMDAGYHAARADLMRSLTPPADQLAADDYAAAVKLDRNNARYRIDYAAALEKLELNREAATQLRTVLELNDRLTKEERKRLPPAQVEEIRKRIEQLERRK